MKAGNYKIKWGYDTCAEAIDATHVTWCEMMLNERKTVLGAAICSNKDHFCRNTGRKISLGRAMKNAGLPKEERTVIWELYRNMTPKKRW